MPHRARKRFGQNFLHDPLVIERIHAAIDARPGEHLVEIGPGLGAITRGLLTRTGMLDVIELDRDLIDPLRQRLSGLGELRIHHADALDFDLHALADSKDTASLRLVGNLPYNLSSPLLFHFLDQLAVLKDLHLMLQKEVVDRIVAEPGSKRYGRLSVMIQSHCQATSLFYIGAGAFRPAPKVESAFLRLRPLRPPPHPVADPELHARIVAAAFGQRRKTLRNSLSGLLEVECLTAAGIDPQCRAEELAVADYARLANLAAARVDSSRPCL
ncbi:MAG: 16S rRNA (adenine(1518)-N(6)/adenine(1519)-N(6))-dimethyltransferase RsmA [Thermochromatium sp.]